MENLTDLENIKYKLDTCVANLTLVMEALDEDLACKCHDGGAYVSERMFFSRMNNVFYPALCGIYDDLITLERCIASNCQSIGNLRMPSQEQGSTKKAP